jgi:hypothetical protein
MCSRAGEWQLFEVASDEFEEYSKQWSIRLAKFYNI